MLLCSSFSVSQGLAIYMQHQKRGTKMKRRMPACILVIILITVLLAGCGENAESVQTSEDVSEGTDTAKIPDGIYAADVVLSGGSGRASVESPCEVTAADGKMTASILWSSPYYDYMIVDGETYHPVNESGNSRFEIPVLLDEDMAVQADTTAMGQPHLIDYTLKFTLTEKDAETAGEDTAEGTENTGGKEAAESAAEIIDKGTAGDIEATPGADEADETEETKAESDRIDSAAAAGEPPEIPGLTFVSEMEKKYAECFSVFYYEDGYKVLTAASGRTYLLVPEGGAVPEELPLRQGKHLLRPPFLHGG